VVTDKEKESIKQAYQDCIDIVNRLKTDPITEMASHSKIEHTTTVTAKDYMVALAEDIVREIEAHAGTVLRS
jgi:hypothetical protein